MHISLVCSQVAESEQERAVHFFFHAFRWILKWNMMSNPAHCRQNHDTSSPHFRLLGRFSSMLWSEVTAEKKAVLYEGISMKSKAIESFKPSSSLAVSGTNIVDSANCWHRDKNLLTCQWNISSYVSFCFVKVWREKMKIKIKRKKKKIWWHSDSFPFLYIYYQSNNIEPGDICRLSNRAIKIGFFTSWEM